MMRITRGHLDDYMISGLVTNCDIPLIQQEESDSLEIEAVAKHLIPGVEIVSLSKHYGGRHNPYALRNLSLKLYKGNIVK